MSADRTYPFDEDLLEDLDWLGEVLGLGEKFTVPAFFLCLAVGVRENAPRLGNHTKSNRGPRTGLKGQEILLMQAVLNSTRPGMDLEPGTDEFVSEICRYANGGLIKIRESARDSEDPRGRLILYLESLAQPN